jgi:hypothetical protein
MRSSVRMVARRLCLRKGLTISIASICIIGLLSVYHLSHRGPGEDGVRIDSPPRNVQVVSQYSLI